MEKEDYYTGLILKKLAADIQPEEERELAVWLSASEQHRQLWQDLADNWHAVPSPTKKAANAFRQLAGKLDLPEEKEPLPAKEEAKSGTPFRTYWLPLAASFIGILLLAAVVFQWFYKPQNILYKTGYGETATFLLPDSSIVTLNANSSLHYTDNWQGQTSRDVWLKGEGFFQVKKQSSTNQYKLPGKFVVHTSDLDVEVLGTQFNVNGRETKTTVVLNSGKIKLISNVSKAQTDTLLMVPGELAEFSADHPEFIKKLVDTDVYSSWKEQKLILDHTTLKEVAQFIERYFGLQVVLEGQEMEEKTLTGSISTADMDTFLTVLSASVQIEIRRKGNTLFLKNKDP